MGRFVCEPCRAAFALRVCELVVVACCEVCGVLHDDWGYKSVALTGGGGPVSRALALRRAKLLRQIAELESDLRRNKA